MRQPFRIEKYDQNITIPSSWSDVTLGEWMQCLKISKNELATDVDFIPVFTGLTKHQVNSMTLASLDQIMACLMFVSIDEIDYDRIAKSKAPYQFTVNGKTYNPTIDFNKFTFGQMSAYQNELKDGKISQERIARCIAICIHKGDWSEEAVDELEKGVMHLPFVEALSIHGFFLNSYLTTLERQAPEAVSQHLKKLQQVIRKSPGNTNGITRFIRSLMGIRRKKNTTSI
jgi:hypothetical protein